jgi:hypothetical protein
MTTKPANEPEAERTPSADDDVEGHSMADPWSAMHIAESRERDMREAARRKSLEEEARRTKNKEGR